jgi:hypothetical protein
MVFLLLAGLDVWTLIILIGFSYVFWILSYRWSTRLMTKVLLNSSAERRRALSLLGAILLTPLMLIICMVILFTITAYLQ